MKNLFGIKPGWRWLTPVGVVAISALAACGASKPADKVVVESPVAINHPVTPDAIDRVSAASYPGSADAAAAWTARAAADDVWANFRG
jgi:hypothetical protein